MKTKLYIGLIGDELSQENGLKMAGLSLHSFVELLLKNAQVSDIASLPFEPILLTYLITSTEKEIHREAEKLNLTTEVLDPLGTTGEVYQADFLIKKCNALMVVHESANSLFEGNTSRAHAIIESVVFPEKNITENMEYFANNDEFLPFLYEVRVFENEVLAHFYRDNEDEGFNTFITDFNNISSELNAVSIQYTDDNLRESLAFEKKEKEYSLAEFYDFGCKFDALASNHQTKSNLGFWVLFSLTLILGASFLLYAKVFTQSPWLLIVYLTAYTGGIFTFYKMKKKASLQKHLAYRLCAEVLRLKLFQLVSYSGNKTDAFQFEKQVSLANVKTDWVAHIVRAFPLHKVSENIAISTRKEIILTSLIEEQLRYFNVKLHGNKDKVPKSTHKPKLDGLEKLLHRFTNTELSIVVFCTFLMIVVTLTAFKVSVFYKLYPIKHIIMFFIGFLPLVGLAFEQLVFNFALEENEMRYHQQISKFKSIKRWLSATESEVGIAKITNQLCIECAQENFSWYTTRINRQHKPASGG